MPGTRRVVTGYGPDYREIIASDTIVEPMTVALMPGAEFMSLWGNDAPAVYPDSGALPDYTSWFPTAGGFRVEEITIPPDSVQPPADIDMEAAAAEMEWKLPGLISHLDPDHPGMHRTDTTDFVYVLAGACVLELDGGARVELNAGDSVVQNGTRHAWRVPYPELSISIGASRKA
jgi:hypothetical protein